MIGDLWIYIEEESCRVLTEPCATREIEEALEKYIFISDVTLENHTESCGMLSVFGPRSAVLVRTILGDPPASRENFHHVNRNFHGAPVLIARSDYTGEDGFDLLAPVDVLESLWMAFTAGASGTSALPVGWDALEVLRVEAGVSRFGQDMDHDTIPLEAGIEARAIDFHKGCYIGQEVIARVAHRGHVNRKLVGLRLSQGPVPARNDPILQEGKRVGEITTAVLSPLFGPIALGYVQRNLARPGGNFLVRGLPAETVDLPFYSRAAQRSTVPQDAAASR